jgi:hypothetical protein
MLMQTWGCAQQELKGVTTKSSVELLRCIFVLHIQDVDSWVVENFPAADWIVIIYIYPEWD